MGKLSRKNKLSIQCIGFLDDGKHHTVLVLQIQLIFKEDYFLWRCGIQLVAHISSPDALLFCASDKPGIFCYRNNPLHRICEQGFRLKSCLSSGVNVFISAAVLYATYFPVFFTTVLCTKLLVLSFSFLSHAFDLMHLKFDSLHFLVQPLAA